MTTSNPTRLIAVNAGIRKIARNGRGWKLAIPRHVIDALSWPLGTHIYIQINPDDTVTLAAVRVREVAATPPRADGAIATREHGSPANLTHA